MIKRAHSLLFSNFRSFTGAHQISLDADVVLIHAANGVGKTSILSALEFAITGSVSDLRKFESDYPKCLTNIDSDVPGGATLAFRDHNGLEQMQSCIADPSNTSVGPLTSEAKTFYADRCYLPQAKLGRLLDIYQERDGKKVEQPLIRFVKELIDVGPLENLVKGVYFIGRSDRLRTAVPAAAQLTNAIESTKQQIVALKSNVDDRLALGEIESQVAKFGIGIESDVSAPSLTVGQMVETLTHRRDREVQHLDLLRIGRSRLSAMEGFDRQFKSSTNAPSQTLIDEARKTLAAQEETIARSLEETRAAAFAIDTSIGQSATVNAPRNPIGECDTQIAIVTRALDRSRENQQLIERMQSILAVTNKRLEEVDKALSRLSTAAVSDTHAKIEKLIVVLDAAMALTDSENCPVCNRNFDELRGQPLKQHVATELAHQKSLLGERRELLSQQMTLQRERSELMDYVTTISPNLTHARAASESTLSLSAWDDVMKALDKVRVQSLEYRSLRDEIVAMELSLAEQKAETQQRTRRDEITAEVLTLIGSSTESDQSEESSVPLLLSRIDHELELSRRTLTLLEDQLTKCRRLEKLRQAETARMQDIAIAERSLAELELRQRRVSNLVARTRYIEATATQIISEMLSNVFSRDLNNLWRGLFDRLARSERFRPTLGTPQVAYGSVTASMRAETFSGIGFDNLGAAMSAGNLNTAALSLFLALHLIEEPRMSLLVLDDPVQNMDDVHVVQLATLIRRIAYEETARRQVVIAIHEKALFEYLCNELAPAKSGDKLIAVEVKAVGIKREISHSVHAWQEDRLQFVS